jgi:hypothetical protein
MTINRVVIAAAALALFAGLAAQAQVKVLIDHNADGNPAFKFKNVPGPVKGDAAEGGRFVVVDGESDPNGSNIRALNDGRLPDSDDDPGDNFFFMAGSDGGRLKLDLGSAIDVKQVNTYSWHSGRRAPQVYNLYASDGAAPGFNAAPKRPTDPATCGWKLIAKVDTTKQYELAGGQYGVGISDDSGSLGKFQYFLFDVFKTSDDQFGRTFYSEMDVRAVNPATPEKPAGPDPVERRVTFTYELDTTQAPDLKEWAETKLKPAIDKWYPVWVDSLASDGFTAPKHFKITFKPMDGVAGTGGTDVEVSEKWIKDQNARPGDWNEAIGSVLHELVHVVQQYGSDRPGAPRTPGWMTEGIADYFRWFHYEPVAHRPVTTARQAAGQKYSGSYKITAGFLNYVTHTHDPELVVKMNAAIREHRYTPDLWVDCTGMTAEDLWKEYVASLPAGSPGGRRGGAAGVTNAPAGVTNSVPAIPPAGG